MSVYFNDVRCDMLDIPYSVSHGDNDVFYVETWRLVKVMGGLDTETYHRCRRVVFEALEKQCLTVEAIAAGYGWYTLSVPP